jgi:hypothetical protein
VPCIGNAYISVSRYRYVFMNIRIEIYTCIYVHTYINVFIYVCVLGMELNFNLKYACMYIFL